MLLPIVDQNYLMVACTLKRMMLITMEGELDIIDRHSLDYVWLKNSSEESIWVEHEYHLLDIPLSGLSCHCY